MVEVRRLENRLGEDPGGRGRCPREGNFGDLSDASSPGGVAPSGQPTVTSVTVAGATADDGPSLRAEKLLDRAGMLP